MMKITQFHDTDKPSPTSMMLAVDVSSRRLDLYTRYRQNGEEYELSEAIFNELSVIEERLTYYAKHAHALGYTGLSIVVEPSGRYEKKLTQTAIQLGHRVWMVNPERMYKAGVIYHGDDSKSDPLDGKVLYMMGRMGKVSQLLPLPEQWQQLRQLGTWLEDCTLIAADLRIRIGVLRRELFVDYDQRSHLTWGPTGQAIQELYGFDPWKITHHGYDRYVATVKAHRKHLPQRCLDRIWSQAQSSCNGHLHAGQRSNCSQQLDYLWQLWQRHEKRKVQLAGQMIQIVDDLPPTHWIPPLCSGFTEQMRAKILAETGPLRQFPHWRALLAYSGLKVRMRTSGKYKGKDKITKKGRILLRKLIGQAAFSLSRKDRILGEYYHRKLSEGMNHGKAKVACMRKFVKILYGAAKSSEQFNRERIYRCAG